MIDLSSFAEQVGSDGPVSIIGLGTRTVGPEPAGRIVRAPAGVDEVLPDEMTVRCGAATPVDELRAALATVGQDVALPEGGTVGGALAVGRSGVTRLGHGPVRDALLGARYVDGQGRVVRAGGPTVKNVSGFDLCRLLVGSHGVLGFLGEVVLRTRPLPPAARWYTAPAGMPFPDVLRRCHRPVAVLHDGTTTWVRLEGHPRDLDTIAADVSLSETTAPAVPTGGRRAFTPRDAELAAAALPAGTYLLEYGTGVIHLESDDALAPPAPPSPGVAALERRIKHAFDPGGRLNPGRPTR